MRGAMVIVVPRLAEVRHGKEPLVGALAARIVGPAPEEMAHRVHCPDDLMADGEAHEATPEGTDDST